MEDCFRQSLLWNKPPQKLMTESHNDIISHNSVSGLGSILVSVGRSPRLEDSEMASLMSSICAGPPGAPPCSFLSSRRLEKLPHLAVSGRRSKRTPAEDTWPLKASLPRLHDVPFAMFYWSKPVTRPARVQKWRNRLCLSVKEAAKRYDHI